MGISHWGLGIRLFFTCFFFVMMLHNCMGDGGNLTKAACSEQDRLALLKFKHSVTDDHGMLSSWVGDDCCGWERVGCDDVTGRVVSLELRRNVRGGYLPVDPDNALSVEDFIRDEISDDYLVGDEVNSCLTELVNLKHLDLSGNNFGYSQIPEFIGSLKQLRYLNLSNAYFSGNVPNQIGNLSNLRVLDLSSPPYLLQDLKTDDMRWISGLSKLEHLDLSGMNLSRTQNLDSLLYTIPSLSKLRLSGCGLSMAHLGNHRLNSSKELANIKHLDLSGNGLRGQLPGLFLNLTSLTFLDLSCSYLNPVSMSWSFENLLNMIPSVSELHLAECSISKVHLSPTNFSLSTHSNIQHLFLSRNEIEGKIPSVLTNMSSLLSIDLSHNSLNSSIPIMPNLLKLDISTNQFRHIEDVGIWRQCNLKELIVSRNILEGEIIGPSTNVSKCFQNALEILYLDNNKLNGSFPESFGRLTNLRRLDLSLNQLTGPIPKALGKLTDLTTIFLNSNRFMGPIPVSLGRLTSLRVFSVSSNLLNGTLPDSIRQLTKLHLLDVSHNFLQGVVSEDLFANLSMLKYLGANSNYKLVFNFSREWIPPFQLEALRLGSCKIEGGFPQWLRTQRKLEELALSNASISGPLPTWLHLMTTMRVLDLSHNNLTGPLSNLPSVYEARYDSGGLLLLQDNLFVGPIPRWLCAWTDLQVLDLSTNRLTGEIPNCLWNMSLYAMLIGSNRLSGVIPSPLGPMYPSLAVLQLSDNKLNGELPRDVGYFKYLQVLDLGENEISGNIPEWIGEDMTGLMALRLHKNKFIGGIPHSLCKSQQLQIIDMAHNNLTGPIPHCFGEIYAMKEDIFSSRSFRVSSDYGSMIQVLKGVELDYTRTLQFVTNMDLSSNKLDGDILEELTELEALVGLNLSYNHFTGGIPKNIGNMKYLNSLDLSANELSGTIPPSIAALNFLSYLNLSHNNLSGRIPTGSQLQTLTDPSIYADNIYLCGTPLSNKCSAPVNLPTTRSKNNDEKSNEPKKVWFYLDIASGFATGFWGIIGVLLFKKQWRHRFFMFCGGAMDKIYVAVTIRVLKIKGGKHMIQVK